MSATKGCAGSQSALGQPGTNIVLSPPAPAQGITDDERRTIAEMMAKGTYATLLLGTSDLDSTFEKLQASDAEIVQEPMDQPYGVRLRRPRPRGQHDPHPGAALSMPKKEATRVARAARCRQPRSDPRAGRPRGNNLKDVSSRAPEAPAHGVHRRLRVRQELAGVRHHAAQWQRLISETLQHLRTGLHADAGTARRRRPRQPHHRDASSTKDGWGPTLAPRWGPQPTPTRCCACSSAASGSRT